MIIAQLVKKTRKEHSHIMIFPIKYYEKIKKEESYMHNCGGQNGGIGAAIILVLFILLIIILGAVI